MPDNYVVMWRKNLNLEMISTYWINDSFDCGSECVIYVLRCISCSKIYVGSTITSFRKRVNNHA
jgi:hypothetical protein